MGEVIRESVIRFNRDTGWLATGLVGTIVFAAIVLAVQEHQPNAKPAESDPAPLTRVIAASSGANGELTTTQDGSPDRALVKTSLEEKVSSGQDESAITASGLAFKPEGGHHQYRQDSARLKRSRASKERSSVALSTAEVKRRLIELWHQSLAENEKSRTWTAFSHLNRGTHKKAAYTAEMSH